MTKRFKESHFCIRYCVRQLWIVSWPSFQGDFIFHRWILKRFQIIKEKEKHWYFFTSCHKSKTNLIYLVTLSFICHSVLSNTFITHILKISFLWSFACILVLSWVIHSLFRTMLTNEVDRLKAHHHSTQKLRVSRVA